MNNYIEDEFVLKRTTCNRRGIVRGFGPSNNYYVVEFFAQQTDTLSPDNLGGGRITDIDILYNGRTACALSCRKGEITKGIDNKDEEWMARSVLRKLREFHTVKNLGLHYKEDMKV